MSRKKTKKPQKRAQKTPEVSRRGPLALKIAFALSVQALAFALTYNSSAWFFTAGDLAGIAAVGAAVNAVLLSPAFIMRRWVNGWLTLVTLGGVFSGYVVHTDLYTGGNNVLFGAIGLAAFTLFIGFKVIDEVRAGGAVLNGLALVATVAMLGAPALMGEGKDHYPDRAPEYFDNIREITFAEKPDLYFLSFDGLAPRSLTKKYLGLDGTELHDLVDARFRRLPNFFSNRMLTHPSFDTLLLLDEEAWERGVKFHKIPASFHMGMFRGQRPSPLFNILKHNGYTISTVIADLHFGYPQGRYVDNYHVLSKKYLVCDKSGVGAAPLAFWGYCNIAAGRDIDDQHKEMQVLSGLGQADFLAERIADLDKSTPQFLLSYLYLPGHFPNDHNIQEARHVASYNKKFVEKSRRAARAIEEILAQIERRSPNAIVFLFGDHGFLHNHRALRNNIEFYVHTGYGALGAIYPPDRCSAELDAAGGEGYMTILDTVHAILGCVSGGQSALVNPRANKNQVPNIATSDNRKITFGVFSYE